jgi:RNA polymerase sigma-70 factor, ECF subfamily
LELYAQQQAFAALIEQHQALIYKVCHLYCKTGEDREDLFQEIVFQLWKSFPSFRGEAKFTTWLYRIALNTAISSTRKNKLGRLTTYVDNLPVEVAQEDQGEAREQANLLTRAIARLSDVEKSIVMLYLEERSYEDMEEILGISQNNLRVKMNRIKEKLRKLTNTPNGLWT